MPILTPYSDFSDLIAATAVPQVDLYDKEFQVRYTTYNWLRKFRKRSSSQRHHLAALLGHRHFDWYHDRLTEDEMKTCLALQGPHGSTIYKILRAKWNLK